MNITAKGVILAVFGLIFGVIFFSLIIVVVLIYFATLVGPIYHFFSVRKERQLLERRALLARHRLDLFSLQTPRGNLIYRWNTHHSPSSSSSSSSSSSASPSSSSTSSPGFHHDVDSGDEEQERQPMLAAAAPAPIRAAGATQRYSVVLPGGLGSTLLATAFIHDRMFEAGFDVLSFDRLGVGFSDEPMFHTPADVSDHNCRQAMLAHIDEMHALLSHIDSSSPAPQGPRKWIIVGGSFGSAVGQLYTALHPEHVVGFVNWDGLPSGLSSIAGQKESFLKVASMYNLEAKMSAVGFFRFPLFLASRIMGLDEPFARSSYSWQEVSAQINSSQFLQTIGNEAPLMMACCDLLAEHWGEAAYFRLAGPLRQDVQDAPPDDIVLDPQAVATLPPPTGHPAGGLPLFQQQRSANTLASPDSTRRGQIKAALAAVPRSSLSDIWGRLATYALSCRNYDYDPGEMFMTEEMKGHYAAEHSYLTLAARYGKRLVFPNLSHGGSLRLGPALIYAITDIAAWLDANPLIPEVHHDEDE